MSFTGRFGYKPFGGILWQSGTKPRRTFIDREEDTESGLGEFEARKYEDESGRFTSIDEKWEEYRAWSPYNYSENDPIRYSDPTGFSKGEYQNKATPPEGVSSISSPPRGGVNMGSTGLGGGAKGSSGRGSGSRSSGGSGRSGGGGGTIAATNHDYDERRPMQQQKGHATLETGASKIKKEYTTLKASKVEKTKTVESIGGKYIKTTEVRPGKGKGQSRAEYVRYKDSEGKVVRTYKDTYDRANKFQHRKPLRGGPEGRPQ